MLQPRPRPSRAPALAAGGDRSRSPRRLGSRGKRGGKPWQGGETARQSLAGDLSPHKLKVRDVRVVPPSLLGELLGPDGSLLRELCQRSGASLTFRHDVTSGNDDLLLEVSGSEAAVDDVLHRLEPILGENAATPDEDLDDELSPCFDPSEGIQAGDQACTEIVIEEIDLPTYKLDFVLLMRNGGVEEALEELKMRSKISRGAQRGGRKEALEELKMTCGLSELKVVNTPEKENIRLQAEGDTDSVSSFLGLMTERMSACEHIQMEFIEVPGYALACLFSRHDSEASEERSKLENTTGTLITAVNKQNLCYVCIRGTAEQVEHAKPLFLERVRQFKLKGSPADEGDEGGGAAAVQDRGRRPTRRGQRGCGGKRKGKGKGKEGGNGGGDKQW